MRTAEGRTLCASCFAEVVAGDKTHTCQPKPGLGDMVAAGLDAIGVTKERVQAVASRVGIKDCGCKRRQQRLNELGKKVGVGR